MGARRCLFPFPLLKAAPFFCLDGMINSLPVPRPGQLNGAGPPGGGTSSVHSSRPVATNLLNAIAPTSGAGIAVFRQLRWRALSSPGDRLSLSA